MFSELIVILENSEAFTIEDDFIEYDEEGALQEAIMELGVAVREEDDILIDDEFIEFDEEGALNTARLELANCLEGSEFVFTASDQEQDWREYEDPILESFDYAADVNLEHEMATNFEPAACDAEENRRFHSVPVELSADHIPGTADVLIPATYTLKYFENDDKKVRHFTGLPTFDALKTVFKFVEKGILRPSNKLTKDQLLILVLIRIRLNFSFQTLGYMFNVSHPTACTYFYSNIYALFKMLRGFIKWPSKELLQSNTPVKFRNVFPNQTITTIIDCFEIRTEKPSTKDAAIKLYSNYKSCYTVKVLIGITPFGSVSFVSKPYTGRTSDKFITENCGFLDRIDEQDLILADRGFTVKRAIEMRGGTLRVPDSASRKRQLSSVAVERTRALASIRNEVERFIGVLRSKYTILNGPLPITMLNHVHNGVNVLHMIITVCCALVNMCPSIIR